MDEKIQTAREAVPYHCQTIPQSTEPKKSHPQHLTIAHALYRCTLIEHPVYGPTLEIQFVDECAIVTQLGFRPSSREGEVNGNFQVLSTLGLREKRETGVFPFRHPLEKGPPLSQPELTRHATDEPYYLRVPEVLFDGIVLGEGDIVLIGKDGEVVDSMPLTKVDGL